MKYREIEGDLIILAKQKKFDVIAHGCNAFCRMAKGIAPQMAEAFKTDKFNLEDKQAYYGDINKLGQIDIGHTFISPDNKSIVTFASSINRDTKEDWFKLVVVNAYTQYKIKKFNDEDYEYTTEDNPFDYEAFTLCMRKINNKFAGMHIGLPQIGSHLAGGDWETIKLIIQKELKDVDVTIVIYKP